MKKMEEVCAMVPKMTSGCAPQENALQTAWPETGISGRHAHFPVGNQTSFGAER